MWILGYMWLYAIVMGVLNLLANLLGIAPAFNPIP